jgi:hypothetical protein
LEVHIRRVSDPSSKLYLTTQILPFINELTASKNPIFFIFKNQVFFIYVLKIPQVGPGGPSQNIPDVCHFRSRGPAQELLPVCY